MHRGLVNARLWDSSKDLKHEVGAWFFHNWKEPQAGTQGLTPGEQVRHRASKRANIFPREATWLGLQSSGSANHQKMPSSNSNSPLQ
jgi:hypothetical protein